MAVEEVYCGIRQSKIALDGIAARSASQLEQLSRKSFNSKKKKCDDENDRPLVS
jgi:hypothetical protein